MRELSYIYEMIDRCRYEITDNQTFSIQIFQI